MEDPFSVAYDQTLLGHYRGMSDEDLDAEIQRLGDAVEKNGGLETLNAVAAHDSAQYDLALAETARRERAKPLGQPFGQHLADCDACKAAGRACDFDSWRGRCSVLS